MIDITQNIEDLQPLFSFVDCIDQWLWVGEYYFDGVDSTWEGKDYGRLDSQDFCQ